MSKERLEPTGQSILNICGGQNATVTKPKIGDFKGKIPENKKILEKYKTMEISFLLQLQIHCLASKISYPNYKKPIQN